MSRNSVLPRVLRYKAVLIATWILTVAVTFQFVVEGFEWKWFDPILLLTIWICTVGMSIKKPVFLGVIMPALGILVGRGIWVIWIVWDLSVFSPPPPILDQVKGLLPVLVMTILPLSLLGLYFGVYLAETRR